MVLFFLFRFIVWLILILGWHSVLIEAVMMEVSWFARAPLELLCAWLYLQSALLRSFIFIFCVVWALFDSEKASTRDLLTRWFLLSLAIGTHRHDFEASLLVKFEKSEWVLALFLEQWRHCSGLGRLWREHIGVLFICQSLRGVEAVDLATQMCLLVCSF